MCNAKGVHDRYHFSLIGQLGKQDSRVSELAQKVTTGPYNNLQYQGTYSIWVYDIVKYPHIYTAIKEKSFCNSSRTMKNKIICNKKYNAFVSLAG